MLELSAIFISLTALLAYVNYRFIGLPPTIGVMATALLFSVLLHGLALLGLPSIEQQIETLVGRIDFNHLLMDGMLSFLLFAGALHINLADLRARRWAIGLLATVGVLFSTAVIGFGTWYILDLFELQPPLIYCLLFGALISPTDPIAVLGIMRSAGAPKALETTIVGESLFNDGVAVVVFTVLLGVLARGEAPGAGEAVWLFFEEAGGGILLGALLGALTFALLKSIDQYQVEVLLTLALVLGGYTLATHLHVSGPIAMVVAGLIIGNQGRRHAMSDHTRENLDNFWELLDEILNAVLFVLIGMELVLLPFSAQYLLIALCVTLLILGTRLAAVGPPALLLRRMGRALPNGTVRILTWGGLRGGISVALVLALPASEERNLLLNITYLVVLFSFWYRGLASADWFAISASGQQRQSLTGSTASGLGLRAVTAIIAELHTADTARPCPPPVRGALQQGESLFWISQATRPVCRAAADPHQVSPVRLGWGVNHTHQRRPFAQNEWRTLQ